MVQSAVLSAMLHLERRLERHGRGDPSKDDAHCDEAQIIDEGDCMRMRRGHLMRDAIIRNQWQSEVQSLRMRSRVVTVPLTERSSQPGPSVVISGHQWSSVVISGHQWSSVALTCMTSMSN